MSKYVYIWCWFNVGDGDVFMINKFFFTVLFPFYLLDVSSDAESSLQKNWSEGDGR